ncbi:hypothetical protein VLK31_32780 [Variovorax sp. H27-G14]|uniref:hypothetical protein n=1 Tax=Variovorax sp. H27-G14 TaxID=3111914 RepID=UPI0038FCDF69
MTTTSEPAFLADLDNKIFTIRTALYDNDKKARASSRICWTRNVYPRTSAACCFTMSTTRPRG